MVSRCGRQFANCSKLIPFDVFCLVLKHVPSGNIDRDEWRETVEFYLELKKEEAEKKNNQADLDHAEFTKQLRANKL